MKQDKMQHSESKNAHNKDDKKWSDKAGKGKGYSGYLSLGKIFMGKLKSNVWLMDSGASHHICFEKDDFYELKNTKETILWGNESTCNVLGKGIVKIILEVGGENVTITLNDVLYVPEFKHRVISLGAMSKHGWIFRTGRNCITGYVDKDVILIGKKTSENFFVIELETLRTSSANIKEESHNMILNMEDEDSDESTDKI
jgi:hypothetical protein